MNAAIYALAAIGGLVVTACTASAVLIAIGTIVRRHHTRHPKATWTPADIYAAHQMGVDPRSLVDQPGASSC